MKLIFRLILFFVLFSFASFSNAVTVNISFSGDITQITDSGELANNGFDTGATTFTGLISYDSTLFDEPSPIGTIGERAFYSPTTAIVTVDGFDFSVGNVLIIDDYDPGTGTDKLWKSTSGAPSVCNFVGDIEGCSLNIRLFDTTGEVLSDSTLPTEVNLNDFDIKNIEIMGNRGLYTIRGEITELTSTVVPIPAAAWLFMSGLIGLVWKGRKPCSSVA